LASRSFPDENSSKRFLFGVFLVVSGPLLLSEAGETYDLYVIGTQESGGTIRRGCVREPKNERKKRQPFFFLLFVEEVLV
jgi:hypothetical protein